MNVILLSGGSGKRLWPLSNDVRSKQFLKLFKRSDGSFESMLQRAYRNIKEIDPNGTMVIASSKEQVPTIHGQLHANVDLSIEPCRKDTFPAIALAAAYLHDKKGVDVSESVVVAPIDPFVDEDYYTALSALYELSKSSKANLILLGVEPTEPSERFGYIIPDDSEDVSAVKMFKEKPNRGDAERYINAGALWNCGVFAFRVGYLLEKSESLLGVSRYSSMLELYEGFPRISFDYAVVENESHIEVARFSGVWNDLGSWNAITEVIGDKCIGKVLQDSSCQNVSVYNELDMPILVAGLSDAVVSASLDGILVSSRSQSEHIKENVTMLSSDARVTEWQWGSLKTIAIADKMRVMRATIYATESMVCLGEAGSKEVWVVASGNGMVFNKEITSDLCPGDSIAIKPGCRYSILAQSEMTIIGIKTTDCSE